MKARLIAPLTVAAVLLAMPTKVPASPPGTAFTVQGRLIQDNQLVDGLVDLKVALFAAATGGTPIAETTVSNVVVKAGLYVAEIDFGAQNLLQGCFLEFQVRIPAGSGTFELVPKRTQITATPYAVHADTAKTANTVTVPLVLNGQTADQTVLDVDQQAASGAAAQIAITDRGNPSFVQKLFTEGTGGAQSMVLSNPANSADAVFGRHAGTGKWGDYAMTNPDNPSPVQSWRHDGRGGLFRGSLTNRNNSSYCWDFDGSHRGGYARINLSNPDADNTVFVGNYAGRAGWENIRLSNPTASTAASLFQYDGLGRLDERIYTNTAGSGEIYFGVYDGIGIAWSLNSRNANSTANAMEIDNAGQGSNLVLRTTNTANTSPGAVLFYDGRSDAWRIVASGPGATGYQANMANSADLGFSTNGSAQIGGSMQADTILANDATMTGTITSSLLNVSTAAMNTVAWTDAFGGNLDIADVNVQNTLQAKDLLVDQLRAAEATLTALNSQTAQAETLIAAAAEVDSLIAELAAVTGSLDVAGNVSLGDDSGDTVTLTAGSISTITFDNQGNPVEAMRTDVTGTTVTGAFSVTGDVTVNGTLNLPNDVSVGGNLDIGGGMKVATDPNTTVPLTFSTPLMGSNDLTWGFDDADTPVIRLRLTRTDLTVDTNLIVRGFTECRGLLQAQAILTQGLSVDGDTELGDDENDTVLVAGTLATGKNLDVGGNTFLGADDTTTTTVRGDLTVVAEISGATLIVAGDSQFGIDGNDTLCANALIQAKGGIVVGDPNSPTIKFNADGSAEICGKLIVKGGIEQRTSTNDVTFPTTETYTIATDDGNTTTTAVEVDGSGDTKFIGNVTVQSDATIAGVLQTSSLRDSAGSLGAAGEFLGIDQTGNLAWAVPQSGGADPNPTFQTVTVTGNTNFGTNPTDTHTFIGDTVIGSTLSTTGNTSFGNDPSDTHTFSGKLTVGDSNNPTLTVEPGVVFVVTAPATLGSSCTVLGEFKVGDPAIQTILAVDFNAMVVDASFFANAPGNFMNGLAVANELDVSGGSSGPAFAVFAGNNTSPPVVIFSPSGSPPTKIFGDFDVVGHFSKGSGTFKIDHPLDPENKYLYHSFVESPDMMNIYNGNVVTDEQGYAVVIMPEWFESLNRDFRYQLTVIDEQDSDSFVMAKVVRQVQGNQFTIRTSEPNVEVSWQVTGVRQDPWANANRVIVEELKPDEERGRYLHPSAYDMPEEMGIQHAAMQRLREARGDENYPHTDEMNSDR